MNGRSWTAADLQQLRELYPDKPTCDVAKALGRGLSGVYRQANLLGLKKSEVFCNSELSGRVSKGRHDGRGAAHRFQKGIVPANKGLRRPGWAPGRMAETQFRPGQRTGKAAQNWKPIGTILADTEGYLRIKVREARHGKEATGFGNTQVWPLYARYLWQQAHGPIPPKHIVAYKDRNRSNCVIENLELISMADNCRRNSMWAQFPRELAVATQLLGALKRRIRRIDGKK